MKKETIFKSIFKEKAVILYSDSKKDKMMAKTVNPMNNKSFTLQELQNFVGGYVELIELPNGK